MKNEKKYILDATITELQYEEDRDLLELKLQEFFENHKIYSKLESIVDYMIYLDDKCSLEDFLAGLSYYSFFDNFNQEIFDFEQEFARSIDVDYDLGLIINYHHNIKSN